MKVLVTGGAGYIGSHTVVELVAAGMEPVIVDNFSGSNRGVLARLQELAGRSIVCHEADVTDAAAMREIVTQERPVGAIHFAGYKAVGESVKQPLKYYRNNVLSTMVLSEILAEFGAKRLVFSSTGSIYGTPKASPVSETAPLNPESPYARTKLAGEMMLRDVAMADPDWRVTLLRYFNPVGAHPSGLIGEDSGDAPNNLMPYIAQVAVGNQPELKVFGDDYDTPDGTCVRDYLHVVDLARAHVQALGYQDKHAGLAVFNLGTGKGSSVYDMIHAFERATGKPLLYRIVGRRAGDPAGYYADPTRAQQELGWTAEKTIDDMCADTWRWQQRNPKGYIT